MKRIINIIALVSVVVLSSCKVNDAPGDNPGIGSGREIRFEIGIAGSETRVAVGVNSIKSTFEDGDEIGVFAVKRAAGDNTATLQASGNFIHNLKLTYSAADGGKWSYAGEKLYYPNTADVYDYYCYYPYDNNGGTPSDLNPTAMTFAVQTDQNADGNFSKSIFMMGRKKGLSSSESVSLSLKHQMAMVDLTTNATESWSQTGMTFTIPIASGIGNKISANLANEIVRYTGSQYPGGSTGILMQPYITSGNRIGARALVPAQSIASGKTVARIEYDGSTYLTLPLAAELKLEAGHASLLSLTLPKPSSAAPIYFRDAEFKAYLVSNSSINTNRDSEISFAEAAAFKGTIDVRNKSAIKSLSGIENFTALKELYCNGTGITELDVSGLGKLNRLDCYSNKQLILLNVSGCVALETLYCYSTGITELDVKNNTALTYLDCSSTGITELDVSGLAKLVYLDCYSNKQLILLNVSGCVALKTLYCYSTGITELDVKNNTALTYLSCYSTGITELDVSGLAKLVNLRCYSNKQLILLNVSGCVALETLSCLSTGITELDVKNNTALTDLSCNNTGITELDVKNNTALTYLDCSSTGINELDVKNNTVLTTLSCSNTGITELDVKNNTALTILYCSSTGITELDVKNNTVLTTLSCYGTGITELDVKNNTALTDLYCYDTGITELDVSRLAKLVNLRCHSNKQLILLNVSGCAVLTTFYCYTCPQLLAVDVSACASQITIRWYSSSIPKEGDGKFRVTHRSGQVVYLHNSSGTIYQPSDKVVLIVKQ